MNECVYEWLQSIGLQATKEELTPYGVPLAMCYNDKDNHMQTLEVQAFLWRSKLYKLIPQTNINLDNSPKQIEKLQNDDSMWNKYADAAKAISKLVNRNLHQQTYKQNVDK